MQNFGSPLPKDRVNYGMLDGERGGGGRDVRLIPYPKIDQHIKYEPPTRPRTLSKVCCGGGVAGGPKAF